MTAIGTNVKSVEGSDYDALLAESLDEIEQAERSGVALPEDDPDRIGKGAVAWYIAYRTVT
ncbi:hypothetical protein [Microbacterium laevaniformans]|uniref:hypothetical protein n=1 Tax=Microbacterium laevaniformans TaxID=36807 RepID=UPI0036315CFE